jgi:hypothetical protein
LDEPPLGAPPPAEPPFDLPALGAPPPSGSSLSSSLHAAASTAKDMDTPIAIKLFRMTILT